MKAVGIDTASKEAVASDHTSWGSKLTHHLASGKEKLLSAAAEKRLTPTDQSLHISGTFVTRTVMHTLVYTSLAQPTHRVYSMVDLADGGLP